MRGGGRSAKYTQTVAGERLMIPVLGRPRTGTIPVTFSRLSGPSSPLPFNSCILPVNKRGWTPVLYDDRHNVSVIIKFRKCVNLIGYCGSDSP